MITEETEQAERSGQQLNDEDVDNFIVVNKSKNNVAKDVIVK